MTSPSTVAFLGPAGTFADAAAQRMPALRNSEMIPAPSISAAFALVARQQVAACLVPMENSVEGSVANTLDELHSDSEWSIRGEVVVPVTFTLVARPGIGLDDVVAVGTHPHAAAQCRGWLSRFASKAAVVPTMSTAGGAAALAGAGASQFPAVPSGDEPTSGADTSPHPDAHGDREPSYNAAIVPALAAQRYGLAVLADDIGDNPNARTRFILVGSPGAPEPATGIDRSTIVLFIRANRAGALLEILTELATRGVNLSRLESRPTKRQLGEYCFSIDLEGHIAEPRVADALAALRRRCADVKYLGSYPRFHGSAHPIREGFRPDDFAAASAWVQEVSGRGPRGQGGAAADLSINR